MRILVVDDDRAVRESLRPRAQSITERQELDRLLAEALTNIPDSHFYIIPARVATTDEPGKTKSDGRGTTGLAIRVAEGNVVAWRVEQGSPAWNAGIRAGQQVERVGAKDADSAMKRVRALPEKAQPRALADMLHGMNGLLTPSVGDTVRVVVAGKAHGLGAIPGSGRVSQFGNLPPIAGLVKEARIPSKSPHGCVGLVAFNIWLPALVSPNTFALPIRCMPAAKISEVLAVIRSTRIASGRENVELRGLITKLSVTCRVRIAPRDRVESTK